MLPLQDLNPTRRFPILTYMLIAINILVFLWELTLTDRELFLQFINIAVVPEMFSQAPFAPESVLDVLRSAFLHGGWGHILGNMLYLYLFGDNIEDRLGKVLFLILYFLSAYGAALAQTVIDPTSPIPMIGASGAIAGVLGSYLVLFPTVRVRGVIPLGFIPYFTELPAFIVLGFWFVLQLFNGIASIGATFADSGVAFFAHIGGFVVGAVLTLFFMMLVPQPSVQQRNQMLYDRAGRYRL